MNLKVFVNDKIKKDYIFIGRLSKKDEYHIFEYQENIIDKYSLCLRMPVSKKTYIEKFHLHPFFDMFIPEGYLFEIFKQILIKNYNISPRFNDFFILKMLAPNIEGRVEFNKDNRDTFESFDIEFIINNDTEDTFNYLVNIFLKKNAISGIQPKTTADRKEKGSITTREYIVKTWGNEYPYLAENEYFCMKAVGNAGIPIPEIIISKNKKFLIVKKFTDKYTGFEEVLGIFGLNRDFKYSGSYEKIAKLFQMILENKSELKIFYKLIVMNFLLGNGDAHLKNFGILYDYDLTNIRLAPAYDVICTIPYITNDKPALTLEGRKIWHKKQTLINFGIKYCHLNKKEAEVLYEECINSIEKSIITIKSYIKDNPHFKIIGNKMIEFWKNSLKEE